MLFSLHGKCPACHRVDPNSDSRVDIPKSCCGNVGDPFFIWPEMVARKFLELSLKRPLLAAEPDEAHIVVVMICTAAEAVLDEILMDNLTHVQGTPYPVAESVLQQIEGRERRLKLFDAIAKEKARVVFDGHPTMPTFLNDWKASAELRNRIVHAKRLYYKQLDLEPVARFRDNFLDGFTLLTNSMY